MKRTSLLFMLLFAHQFVGAQVRSDTTMIWVNDSLAIKPIHVFNSFGFLSYSNNGEDWQSLKKLGIRIPLFELATTLSQTRLIIPIKQLAF